MQKVLHVTCRLIEHNTIHLRCIVTKWHYIDTKRTHRCSSPDNKVHGANAGPTWGQQDPGGPHVGLMNFVIWDAMTRR